MTMNQLRYFQVLARTEHYGRAAETLFISQPSLSRAIALLEEELNVELFARQGRNIVLTRAGQGFLQYVDQALAELGLGVNAMRQYAQSAEPLSVGCITPFLEEHVFHEQIWKAIFSSGSPRVNATVAQTVTLLSDLKKRRYDLVFCSYAPAEAEVAFIPIMEMPFVVVLREDDVLAQEPAVRPEVLRGRDMVLNMEPVYSALIQRLLDYYAIEPVVRGTSNEDSLLLRMVSAGLGIMISTEHQQLYGGKTVLRPLLQDAFHRYIYLAYLPQAEHSRLAQRIISMAQACAVAEEGLQPKASDRAGTARPV